MSWLVSGDISGSRHGQCRGFLVVLGPVAETSRDDAWNRRERDRVKEQCLTGKVWTINRKVRVKKDRTILSARVFNMFRIGHDFLITCCKCARPSTSFRACSTVCCASGYQDRLFSMSKRNDLRVAVDLIRYFAHGLRASRTRLRPIVPFSPRGVLSTAEKNCYFSTIPRIQDGRSRIGRETNPVLFPPSAYSLFPSGSLFTSRPVPSLFLSLLFAMFLSFHRMNTRTRIRLCVYTYSLFSLSLSLSPLSLSLSAPCF